MGQIYIAIVVLLSRATVLASVVLMASVMVLCYSANANEEWRKPTLEDQALLEEKLVDYRVAMSLISQRFAVAISATYATVDLLSPDRTRVSHYSFIAAQDDQEEMFREAVCNDLFRDGEILPNARSYDYLRDDRRQLGFLTIQGRDVAGPLDLRNPAHPLPDPRAKAIFQSGRGMVFNPQVAAALELGSILIDRAKDVRSLEYLKATTCSEIRINENEIVARWVRGTPGVLVQVREITFLAKYNYRPSLLTERAVGSDEIKRFTLTHWENPTGEMWVPVQIQVNDTTGAPDRPGRTLEIDAKCEWLIGNQVSDKMFMSFNLDSRRGAILERTENFRETYGTDRTK